MSLLKAFVYFCLFKVTLVEKPQDKEKQRETQRQVPITREWITETMREDIFGSILFWSSRLLKATADNGNPRFSEVLNIYLYF